MKRQKRYNYSLLDEEDDRNVPMHSIAQHRFENAIEAEVQDGDTLQAIALRFHCSVTEIKRLNKIDKDNEIYARKTIKVPITPHSILLETLPNVHKSGQNSPKRIDRDRNGTAGGLETNQLSEKLMVASVVTSELSSGGAKDSINDIILNSRLTPNMYTDERAGGDKERILESLLSGEIDETLPHPRPLRGPSASVFECSGSDCDISWICLLVCILALCFAIPLIYVLYIAENKFKHDELIAHNHSIQNHINASNSTKFST